MFCLEDLEDFKFVFNYKANGNDVKIIANINEDEVLVNGNSLGVNDDDFDACEDYDDWGVEIGKRLIKDSDSDIIMEVIPSSNKAFSSYKVQLNQQLDYKTDLVNDCILSLGDINCNCQYQQIFVIEDDDVDNIRDMIDDNDYEGLSDWIWEHDEEDVFFDTKLPIWDETSLGFDLSDANGNVITEGQLTIRDGESNFDYKAFSIDFAEKKLRGVEYLLMKLDIVDKQWYSFSVPKDFNVNGIHLINNHDLDHFYVDGLGDRSANLSEFRYNGKLYKADDDSNCGTRGWSSYYLLKFNNDNPKYPHFDVLCQCSDD